MTVKAHAKEVTAPAPPIVVETQAAAWRRSLGLLWLGQVVSHLGDALFLVAVFFLALEVTGSKAMSAVLVAMNFLPALALGLFAGAIVDRYDRRRLMIAADLVRTVAVGAIPVLYHTGNLGTVWLAVAMFSLATGTTVFNPAIKALLPTIIPAGRLTPAVALFQSSEYIALVIGPALAAVAIPRLGMVHLFTLDALTFLFSALCLMALPDEARRFASRAPVVAILDEIKIGLESVRRNPVLRAVLILAAIDNLMVMGLTQVGTALLVKERLGLGPEAYARVQMFFFLGLATASAGVWLLARELPKGLLILVGVALDGLTFIPLAFCRTLPQVQAAMFLHAIAIPLIIIPRTVLIQQSVPGLLHGRVFAIVNVTVFGMTAISTAAVGWMAERVAPHVLFGVLGAMGALSGIVGLGSRRLRATR